MGESWRHEGKERGIDWNETEKLGKWVEQGQRVRAGDRWQGRLATIEPFASQGKAGEYSDTYRWLSRQTATFLSRSVGTVFIHIAACFSHTCNE